MSSKKDSTLDDGGNNDSGNINTDNKGSSNGKDEGKNPAQEIGAAVPLVFPGTTADPTSHLAPLRDNHSAFTAVARSCLLINQYAGSGSSSAVEDNTSVAASALFLDSAFATTISGAFAALIECIQTHDDRRAKISACKTLSLVARATYSRIRHSPHLFSIRDSTNTRLEDEIGTDVPMALCSAALDDSDDGVSAAAVDSLGTMTLSTKATFGTLAEDELLREIQGISTCRQSPHAPTMIDIEDEDPLIPQMELQSRIFENVVSPRLLQLVCRVTNYESVEHMRIVLPFVTASLVHLSKISPALKYGMDRNTYAKRWAELDFVSLVNDVVELLILPAMQSSVEASFAHAAAMAGIRLANACPQAHWVLEVCQWAIVILQENSTAQEGSALKFTNLAAILICSRVLTPSERYVTLQYLIGEVLNMPSTTITPHGVVSPGLLMHSKGISQYRCPGRIALIAEIGLSFFMDGPSDSDERSKYWQKFLESDIIVKKLGEQSKSSMMNIREELALALCMVGVEVGRRHRVSSNTNKSTTKMLVPNSQAEFDEWLKMAVVVITTFAPCIGWGTPPAYMEEELSLLVAAQAAYVRLVQEVLHAVGLLNPLSVCLKMAPTASPPNMLWDQMEESAAYLGDFDVMSSNETMVEPVATLMDDFVKKELKGQGIVSHHMRLFLLSLAADQWVQGRYLARRQVMLEGNTDGAQAALNMHSARELLVALSPRRVFSKIVESHKSQIENYSKKKKELCKKYAQDTVTVCVACIENIALTACDWRKRFGASAETKHLLSLSVASLQGKNLTESENDAQAPVLPVCQGAIDRIQAAFANSEPASADALPLSPLLTGAGTLKRRPVVTAARSQQDKDSYNEGYMMQLSRQIIATRIKHCLITAPTVYSLLAPVRKRNWLRLSLPSTATTNKTQRPTAAAVSTATIPSSRFTWGLNSSFVNGGSDAAAVTTGYSLRRCMRYDGEDEFRLMVTMRVHNVTPVEIPQGLRLELGIVQNAPSDLDWDNPTSSEVLKSLGVEDISGATPFTSAMTIYKHELKCGEHLTWQIFLNHTPIVGSMEIHPSVVYRSIEMEEPYARWVGVGDKKDGQGDTSVVSAQSQQSGGSKSGPNDPAASEGGDGGGGGGGDSKADQEELENVILPGEPMYLSPLIGLQPCPLVFFQNVDGDIDSFRFLWSRMPFQVAPLRVVPLQQQQQQQTINNGDEKFIPSYDATRLASMSSIYFSGESIPGGIVTKLWAFMSVNGHRVLCVMAESEPDNNNNNNNNNDNTANKTNSGDKTIHVRGDNTELLLCLTGKLHSRKLLVSSLVPGFCPL